MLRSLGHTSPKSVHLMGRSTSEETGEVRISCCLANLSRHYQISGLAEVRDSEGRGVCV